MLQSTIFDLALSVPLIFGAIQGLRKGLISSLASLIGLLLGVWGAIQFAELASHILQGQFEIAPGLAKIISYIILFILILFAVKIVGFLVSKVVNIIQLGFIDKILGVVFGILKSAFFTSLILLFVNFLDNSYSFIPKEAKNNSYLYEPLSSIVPSIYSEVMEISEVESTPAPNE